MKSIPLQADIERRLLVNYRADPEVTARLLPRPLRVQLVDDSAVVGICLIRLGHVRPRGAPRGLGLRSEGAAHRIAVEWDSEDGPRQGVYIPRRDTASAVNTIAGGRLFPGVHHRARFAVDETASRLSVGFVSHDQQLSVAVVASTARELEGTLFSDTEAASLFFRSGPTGLSPGRRRGQLEGLELSTDAWRVQPMNIEQASPSFFDDSTRFPPGSIELDSALAMFDVPVRWQAPSAMPPRADDAVLAAR